MIKLLESVIGKLLLPLLKNHGNIFFFPLILQLVNDESNSCREAVARVIISLFQRSSMDQLQTYYDYMKQWFLDKKESGAVLRRTSAQLMGFLVEIRADFFVGRKNKLSIEVADMIQRSVLQSKLAKEKGIMRRLAVFKCFVSIFTTLSKEDDEKKRCFNTITPYLEVLLEALHRAVSEVEAAVANTVIRLRSSTTSSVPSASDLPKEVMNLLEEKCGTEAFLAAYSSVKMKAREKKMARKQQVLSEAVRDPKEAAKRKILKQSKEKERKKRKIQERKASRGVFTKKPRI